MIMNLRYILIYIVISLMGCSESNINISDIPGEYYVSSKGNTEKIIINVDGTYEQTLTFNKKTYVTSGKWIYDPDKKMVRFTNPMDFARSKDAVDYEFQKESTTYDDAGKGRGYWQARLIRENDSIVIKLHDDTSLRFKKSRPV